MLPYCVPYLLIIAYNIPMDDRNREIVELGGRVKDNQARLNMLLEDLGEALLGRSDIAGAEEKTFPEPELFQDIIENRRLHKEIEDSEASITEVEIHIARLRKLEEDVEAGEQESAAQARELSGYYLQLGKLVLEDSSLDDFSVSFRTQEEALVPKIKSLEDRLAELTNQTEGGNVFTWIGKSTQGMVLRSFLTKSLENLERLYRNAGEQFFRQRTENSTQKPALNSEIPAVVTTIEKNRSASAALGDELRKFRDERRGIDREFSASGGPLKQIQGLRKNISRAQEALKSVHLHFGQLVSGDMRKPEKTEASKKKLKNLMPEFSESEQAMLDEIKRIRQLIQDDSISIEKLKASLEIDEEWRKIEKYRSSIADKKARIEEAEKNISEYENRIKASRKRIEELQQLL